MLPPRLERLEAAREAAAEPEAALQERYARFNAGAEVPQDLEQASVLDHVSD